MEQNNKSQEKRQAWLIGIIVVLTLTNLILLYLFIQRNQEVNQQAVAIEEYQEEIDQTSAKLDSISQELDKRIEEARALNQDYEALLKVKEQLERDKEQLKNANARMLREYEEKIKAYEELLIAKDKELEKWREIANELNEEVVETKKEKMKLVDSISSVQKEKQKLEQTLAQAAILKAEGIRILALNSRGREREDDAYRARQIDKIKIVFNLAENKAAKAGPRQIYLRLIEPSGAVLVGPDGGRFQDAQGQNLNYTTLKQVMYDQSSQEVSIIYDKGGEYREGTHVIELYCEGHLIGRGSFVVK
ncbi:MAG: hypothetical protein KatS3mg033_0443 [Thermonema sp.]|uniref:hypothetical protein n=1 Tax=Thermonema sp. TaxID=2231181 RepID=UPI0021DD86BB|nr:hypothetical protein [Thermonema sp.]GIV38643.1 MAG: hypothetical protein KatS3mg033_0443 [Thermonema sp.]